MSTTLVMEHINAGLIVKKNPGAWNDLVVDKNEN